MASVARARKRQPEGLSTGGQFASETKAEAVGISLSVSSVRPAPNARDLLDATELKEVADLIRQRHPEAVEFAPTFDEDDASITYRTADGNTGFAELDQDDDPMFTGAGNLLAGRLADKKGFIPLEHVDQEHAQSTRINGPATVPPIIGLNATNEQMVIAHTGETVEVTRYQDFNGNQADVLANPDGTYTLSTDLSDEEAWHTDNVTAEQLEPYVRDAIDSSRARNAAFSAGLDYQGYAFELTDVNREADGHWEVDYRSEDEGDRYTARWSEQDGLKITMEDGLDMTLDAQTVAEDILGRSDGDADAFFRDAESRYQAGGAA